MKPPGNSIEIVVNGCVERVESGISVAAALFNLGEVALRHSVAGQARGVLCGMGVCFECRVTVDGIRHQRACLVTVADGMTIGTGLET